MKSKIPISIHDNIVRIKVNTVKNTTPDMKNTNKLLVISTPNSYNNPPVDIQKQEIDKSKNIDSINFNKSCLNCFDSLMLVL